MIYANFPRSYRVFFFSTVSFAPALLLLRRPVMASADAPVMDLIFFFFFTDAAFLHITPFFVNPPVYSFFFYFVVPPVWSFRVRDRLARRLIKARALFWARMAAATGFSSTIQMMMAGLRPLCAPNVPLLFFLSILRGLRVCLYRFYPGGCCAIVFRLRC